MKIYGQTNGKDLKIGIVVSRFNEIVTNRLVDGAVQRLIQSGVKEERIDVIQVPGALEIPRIIKLISESGKYDGAIALGAVVKGETSHFDYVCSESAHGVADVSLNGKIPVMYGILTTENMSQALNRAGGKAGNKGAECASDVLEVIDLEKKLN